MPVKGETIVYSQAENFLSDEAMDTPVGGAQAARLLGLCATRSLNRTRRRLERYLVQHNGAAPQLHPVPSFVSEREYRAFAREHVLVVPEWGGRSVFGGDWSYLPSMCAAWSRITRYGDAGRK